MLEIETKEGKALISESGVIAIQIESYYPQKDIGYYSVEVRYKFGMAILKFTNEDEANNALSYIKDNVSGVKNTSSSREDYVKGFKDGVEYALKLKGV